MKITAKLNHLRIAPRKARMVADMIRKKNVEQAQSILNFTVKRATGPLLKLLNSAIASAKNNFQIEPDNLYISKITVDEGPKLKRWRARSRGRAMEIQKKTSHITLVLDEIKPGKTVKKSRSAQTERKKEEKEVSKTKEPVAVKKEQTTKEMDVEKREREKAKDVARREKKSIEATQKPIERGGIRRFFRRKSF